MEIVAGIVAGVGALGGLLDDWIFTDEERAKLDAQKQSAQAQLEVARLAQETAMLEAAAKIRQSQAMVVAGVTLASAIVVATIIWRASA